jgi:uncharacterized delta-60 repeat protein
MYKAARRATLAAFAAVAPALPAGAAAAPIDLDRGYGTAGHATIGFDQVHDRVLATAITPDGSLVGVGSTDSGALVFRLDATGRPDLSFGLAGMRALNAGGLRVFTGVAVQPDGRVVLVGDAGTNVVVARLLPDGRPDATFDGDGFRTIDSGGDELSTAVALQRDGRIVVAGITSIGRDGAVYRLNADGSLDSTFDGDGARGIDSGGSEILNALAIQPDGKIVAVGHAVGNGAAVPAAVYRLNPDGSPDSTFDGDGARGIQVGAYAAARWSPAWIPRAGRTRPSVPAAS